MNEALTYYSYTESPVGRLLLSGSRDMLKVIGFPEGKRVWAIKPDWQRWDEPFKNIRTQLAEYFSGQRREFDVEIAPEGTAFQLSVLKALQQIPYGETCTYGDIAERIGSVNAMRAVGNANGRNPLPIVIPCHRVIGANGSLTGFGGGLTAKRHLLTLEAAHSGLFRPG